MKNKIEYVHNKCYGCQKRKLGCHSNCDDYKKYKEYLEKIKQKERVLTVYRQYECDKHEAFLKKNKNLRGRN